MLPDLASKIDCAHIFASAQDCFYRQRSLSLKERLADIRQVRLEILARRDEIIERVMQDVGKSRSDALIAEIIGSLDWILWLEKHAEKILADKKVATPITLLGKKSLLMHDPYGVVLIICPWNYPFHNAITGIVAAYVAGNTVIYKPSEHAPCEGLVEEILACAPRLREAVQIVYGAGDVGQALIDQGPGKVFFTGSGQTGSKIMAQAARQLIPVELELGGKDPMLVFADASLQRSVAAALWGAFTNAGQSCSAVERLLLEETIHQSFCLRLVEEAKKLVVKEYDADGSADIGRMTTAFQRDKVIEHVQDALRKGARILYGQLPEKSSLLVKPIILDQVKADMKVWHEETFGPVLPIMTFRTEAEAIQQANASEYGLCASVFTSDHERALRITRSLDVGGVSINNVNMSEGNPGLPFGGAKKSGFGKLRGPEGLLGFTRSKAVLIDRNADKIEANWYPYTKQKYQLFERFLEALYQPRLLRLVRVAFFGLRLEAFSQKPRTLTASDSKIK